MKCVCCGQEGVAAPKPEWRSRCWWALPAPTRAAYEHGADIKKIVRASQEKSASVKNFGGGKC